MWHKPDGTYTAAPSTSPEHGPVDEGVTFAHAVVREILLDAIQASKVLGTDAKERKQWENVLTKLVPYRIGRYGQLLEWSTDIDDPKDEHRHVNHLFGLHPGHTISPVTTPNLHRQPKWYWNIAETALPAGAWVGNSTNGHDCKTETMRINCTAIC